MRVSPSCAIPSFSSMPRDYHFSPYPVHRKRSSPDFSPVMAALLGMVTGIGGGMTRDIFLAEIPQVLRSDLYAVAALAGASVVVAGDMLGIGYGICAIAGAALCFVLRYMAIRHGWRLPSARLSAQRRAEAVESDDGQK